MLNNLEQVKWGSLKTCHGSGSEVPKRILELTSNDAEIRAQALDILYDSLQHQGDICEVTSYVVPFLVELISHDQTQDKANTLDLLVTVVPRWMKNHSPENGNIDHDNVSSPFAQKTYDAVREGIWTYLSLLQEKSAEVRRGASRILSLFRDNAIDIAPKLLEQVEVEDDSETKATIIWYLGKLTMDNSSLPNSHSQLLRILKP